MLEDHERINQYDYNKMLKNFETEARRMKILRGIQKKWRIKSCKHDEKVEEMKEKTEEAYRKKQREFKNKLQKKEETIQRQKELRNEFIMGEKKRRQEIAKKKSDDVLKNLEEFNRQQEMERIQLENDTFNKRKKNF